MQKKSYLIIVLAILSFSCNNVEKSKKDTDQSSKKLDVVKKLSVSFNFKTNKADVFKIMMNNIVVDELQKKNIEIFENVIPSSNVDAIVAKFDPGNMSNNIVFHLGNKTIKEVEIKSILVSYGNNQYNISTAKDLSKYFVFNQFIERDSLSKKLIIKKVDGKLFPFFTMKQNLIKLLKGE
ncbi:MAG TPA: hypothetical protein DHV22_01140 [Xanthomarina gelatinilytica]|uniref:Lipoprotein n=1 Tax=Xanthomarina gelatinilytica TaxID=1137281 RepID=A0A3D6BNP7_9FLAO|nr:hypothetical protein [Xanthomarina gelatinilytica]|tara:strand:+ start:230 stop:769 length:540 start_codon:yes stop_codon:yes gene_type:complete